MHVFKCLSALKDLSLIAFTWDIYNENQLGKIKSDIQLHSVQHFILVCSRVFGTWY